MSKFALLLRMNPDVWPHWKESMGFGKMSRVWFSSGRRIPGEIKERIPVVVLGTQRLGIVGYGQTTSPVIFRSDPDWKDVSIDLQESYRTKSNRFEVILSGARVNQEFLFDDQLVAELHRRRETTTWLSEREYLALVTLIEKHNKAELSIPFAPPSLTP